MSVLTSTKLLRPVLPFQRLYSLSRSSWFHKNACLFTRAGLSEGPLSLASLGYRREYEPSSLEKRSKVNEIPLVEPKLKPVKSNKPKLVATRRPLEIVAAPFAAQSFSELGLPPVLIQRLEKEGFEVPTDVQSAAIPTILKNHDVVIQSYTGSGKTLAYLLPILTEVGPLSRRSYESDEDKKPEIEAVIIAPSRELGMQIVREVEKLLGPTEKKAVQQLVGGANPSRQEEALKKNKPSIVVGTPGRIAQMSASGRLHTHGCRFLVLDEVDELLSFNFREDMHRILEHVGKRPGQ